MSFVRRDFLRRLIEDSARVLAAIMGLRQSGQLDEAEQQIEEASAALLGALGRDAELLDAQTVARLLGAERVRVYAALIAERAELRAARGDLAGAATDRLRAAELGYREEA